MQSNQVRVYKSFKVPKYQGPNTDFTNDNFSFDYPGSGFVHQTIYNNESKDINVFLKGKK